MTRTTEGGSILAKLRNLASRYPNLPKASMLLLYTQQGLLGRLDASAYADIGYQDTSASLPFLPLPLFTG